jgi:hypothetical protein
MLGRLNTYVLNRAVSAQIRMRAISNQIIASYRKLARDEITTVESPIQVQRTTVTGLNLGPGGSLSMSGVDHPFEFFKGPLQQGTTVPILSYRHVSHPHLPNAGKILTHDSQLQISLKVFNALHVQLGQSAVREMQFMGSRGKGL